MLAMETEGVGKTLKMLSSIKGFQRLTQSLWLWLYGNSRLTDWHATTICDYNNLIHRVEQMLLCKDLPVRVGLHHDDTTVLKAVY